jgi:hypothetical protein
VVHYFDRRNIYPYEVCPCTAYFYKVYYSVCSTFTKFVTRTYCLPFTWNFVCVSLSSLYHIVYHGGKFHFTDIKWNRIPYFNCKGGINYKVIWWQILIINSKCKKSRLTTVQVGLGRHIWLYWIPSWKVPMTHAINDMTWMAWFEMNNMIWHEWHDLTWMTWFDMNDMIWHEWHDLTWMTWFDMNDMIHSVLWYMQIRKIVKVTNSRFFYIIS